MLYTALFFIVLLLISAIFSGTETAITSVNEISLSSVQGGSSRRQKIVTELVKDKRSVIAAILVGNNIVNTVLAVYAGVFFDQVFVETGMLSEKIAPMVASVITIVFLLIFGEIVPKHLASLCQIDLRHCLPAWAIVKVLSQSPDQDVLTHASENARSKQ